MTLAEARALCPGLTHEDYRPDKDQRALEAFARWMVRFSPSVAVEAPDAIFLDVTGSEKLFGGFDRLNRLVIQTLSKLNLGHGGGVGIAIAPTPGAAWALASFGKNSPQIVAPEQLREALSPLPTAALRLEGELVDVFRGLGVETVGQLMELPRETLPARFGATVLARIDQALGRVPEPLLSIEHHEPIHAKLDFDEPIEALDMLEFLLKQLLREVVDELKRRGCGARKLVIDFLPRYSPPIQKTIPLSRPTCDPRALFNLLRCALETVKGKEGFVGLRLSVPLFERMTDEQLALLGEEFRAAESEWGHLVERLKVRMGEGTVLAPRLFESHLPEKAYRYADALSPSPGTPGEGRGSGEREWEMTNDKQAMTNAKRKTGVEVSSSIGRLSLPVCHSSFPIAPRASGKEADAPYPRMGPLSPGTPGERVRVRGSSGSSNDETKAKSSSSFSFRHSDIRNSSLIRHSDSVIRVSPAPLRITECALIKFKLPDPPRNSSTSRPRKKQPPPPPDRAPKPRPLHLLTMPVEVRCMASPSPEREGPPLSFVHRGVVHQITRAGGPERITGTWWEGRHKTRDYFDVEDPTGKRFWMFRVSETRKWYVHGVFNA